MQLHCWASCPLADVAVHHRCLGVTRLLPKEICPGIHSLLPAASGSLYSGGLSAPFLEYSRHLLAAAAALFALSVPSSSFPWYRVGDPQISVQELLISEYFLFVIRVLIFSKTFDCLFSQRTLANLPIGIHQLKLPSQHSSAQHSPALFSAFHSQGEKAVQQKSSEYS